MTSLIGHLMNIEFPQEYSKWHQCEPSALFTAKIITKVDHSKAAIARNLKTLAVTHDKLIVWTDCDREGEAIGWEVVEICKKANPNIRVERAQFSSVTPQAVASAMASLRPMHMPTVTAVQVRSELDLRFGAIFTRLQCLRLQSKIKSLEKRVISYGSCQFPTLGFIVEQDQRVKEFKPETFYFLKLIIKKTTFNWKRERLYDRTCTELLCELATRDKKAKIDAVTDKPTSKRKPAPLTTIEMQKFLSRYYRISSDETMTIAEKLYNDGLISYPRTETDQFDTKFDFQTLIDRQKQHPLWGEYASSFTFQRPRNGRNNDQSHPPIHPTGYSSNLTGNYKKVYDFIVRRFLGACSTDATGSSQTVEASLGGEMFWCKGLLILQRNYLEVYIYDKWSATTLPEFTINSLNPYTVKVDSGTTTSPLHLSEADLIATMYKNGIGTDATIHEHIAKVQERQYAIKCGKTTRFKPTSLGSGIVQGYDSIGLNQSLTRPALRASLETDLVEIIEGKRNRNEIVEKHIRIFREVYSNVTMNIEVLIFNVDKSLKASGDDLVKPTVDVKSKAKGKKRGKSNQETPLCLCKKASKEQRVIKAGVNKGKLFYCCPGRDCKFFEWVS